MGPHKQTINQWSIALNSRSSLSYIEKTKWEHELKWVTDQITSAILSKSWAHNFIFQMKERRVERKYKTNSRTDSICNWITHFFCLNISIEIIRSTPKKCVYLPVKSGFLVCCSSMIRILHALFPKKKKTIHLSCRNP